MNIFFWIFLSTFLISLISFSGALVLFLREKLLETTLLCLVAFSAGALMGTAFLHLLPEAVEETGGSLTVFLYLIIGFTLFFILEQFIGWHHHDQRHQRAKSFSYLILVSDALHNFIDGLIIAASFVIAVPVGIATAVAVALHEIPQEIGDFGILVYGGIEKIKALFLNFFTAITVVFGGLVGFLLAGKIGQSIVFLLPFAAGSFVYIASSDLIPEIKHRGGSKMSIIHFLFFATGLVLMLVLKLYE